MFSSGIPIRTSDGHAVFNIETKEIINLRKSVLIEPHVWIGENVIVLKGARIGRGSIIGARSIVSGTIGEFTSAIGVPARELQSGVSWTRQGRPSLSQINEAFDNCLSAQNGFESPAIDQKT
jgi:acetyltransferase-like isoleucine patch superfamily enzyme